LLRRLIDAAQESSCLRLLRLISARPDLKIAVNESDASAHLLGFVCDVCRLSRTAMLQSSIANRLFAFYEATASATDALILELLCSAETEGGRSLRAVLPTWAPPSLRKTSDARGVEVLASLDAPLALAACRRVMRRASDEEDFRAYDPAFLLPLLSAFLDNEKIGFSDWLGLASAHVLGLAVCALASPEPTVRSLGDRTLAKLVNRLSVRKLPCSARA
jgi:hypothetical protein